MSIGYLSMVKDTSDANTFTNYENLEVVGELEVKSDWKKYYVSSVELSSKYFQTRHFSFYKWVSLNFEETRQLLNNALTDSYEMGRLLFYNSNILL